MSRVAELVYALNVRAKKAHCSGFQIGEESAHIEPGKVKCVYACPVCAELYDTRKEADACASQPFNEAGVKVGDIFIIPNSNRYEAPAEGFEHWSAFHLPGDPSESSHFDHSDQWFPYYVVTAIHRCDREPHRAICTVVTLFDGFPRGGWNPTDSDGHNSMFKPGLDDADQPTDVGSTWWESTRNGKTMGERFASAETCATLQVEAKELADMKLSTRALL